MASEGKSAGKGDEDLFRKSLTDSFFHENINYDETAHVTTEITWLQKLTIC